jgi:hypothetical protein
VQIGLNLCLAERFRFARVHFHTVFNRTVENFYKKFIFSGPFRRGMVSKVPCRVCSILFWKWTPLYGLKKKFSDAARKLAACISLCALAISSRAAAKYPRPQ